MKTSANYAVKVLATGLIVLLLFAVLSLGGRFLVNARLVTGLPNSVTHIHVSPSALLPYSLEFDPNASNRSAASGDFSHGILVRQLGLADYLVSRAPQGRRSDVFYYHPDEDNWMYFDRVTGQIVFRNAKEQSREPVTYYAGPDGVSESPASGHGRFVDPMVSSSWGRCFVYDRGLRRFFSIDRQTPSVQAGPPLEESAGLQPVWIGSRASSEGMYLDWQPPERRAVKEKKVGSSPNQHEYVSTLAYRVGDVGGYLPVIDASGRIDLLDRRTLELKQGHGFLPMPLTLYGRGSQRPDQLLDYGVELVSLGRDAEYLGMLAGSVSRQGTSMTLAVYNKDGRQTKRVDTDAYVFSRQGQGRAVPSAEAALFDVPWGPALTIFKYLLESLHPPILSIASFFTANDFDARASHRALFLLPNSFVAMHRGITQGITASQVSGALWTMLPAVLLAIFLGWRVGRDATIVGLSGRARTGWIVGTIAFGLPAYITYRMTRPRAVLVTCRNCGRPRRPDMDRCHRCNSPWSVPELVPPAWRVLDGGHVSSSEADESEKPAAEAEPKSDSSVETM